MYAEPTTGKSNVAVFGIGGLRQFASVGDGPIRGMSQLNGVLCVVSSNTVYTISASGTGTSRGTIQNTGLVDMASNGTYICIVTGVGNPGYLFDGTTVTQITDTDFGGADTVDSLDGYFIFSDRTGSFFINETPFNGANYDALDFASAESNPDIIKAVFVDHREVFLLGSETVEAWYNSGDPDFPFERTPGAIIEKGTASPWAISKVDNSVIWLDDSGVCRRLSDGYGSQRISTHEVESAFSGISTARSFSFTEKGHEFFVLTTDSSTWVYDAATNLWHERRTVNKNRWRAQHQIKIYGKNLVGDFESGNIYWVDQEYKYDNGETIIHEMIFPPISMDGEKFKLSKLQLDLEQGTSGDVRLWLSNDGETWRSAGIRSVGAIGKTEARTIWRNLGQHRNLHLRFTFSDAVEHAVFSAYATLT